MSLATSSPLPRRRRRPRPWDPERLEARHLLAAVINTFPVPTAGSEPNGIATGPDGNQWFTESVGNQIGRISPASGVVTEFAIPTANSEPFGITAGPDGNLWFTESRSNRIGRISPATGVVTEFAIPTADARPDGITAGPDGNLWFSESNIGDPGQSTESQIGRISTATGVVTMFAIPTANAHPSGIAAGPDGNLWFTEGDVNKIGRISPVTGVITEFDLPNAGSHPADIAVGPDGNLWFTEAIGQRIGRISPATGIVTEYASPTQGAFPTGIAAGTDGNLWFTEDLGNRIGQINPATGVITEFPLTDNFSTPTGIVAGPDDNIWFTEGVPNQIGQVVVPPSTILPPPPVVLPTPPTVSGVQRFGFHARPTSLVITFGAALDPARARDLANYTIVAPNGRTIPITSATYNAATDSVTLRPGRLLNVHWTYHLTVRGTPPGGLTDAAGGPLDGVGDGKAGSDYTAAITRSLLVIPARPTAASAHAAVPHRATPARLHPAATVSRHFRGRG